MGVNYEVHDFPTTELGLKLGGFMFLSDAHDDDQGAVSASDEAEAEKSPPEDEMEAALAELEMIPSGSKAEDADGEAPDADGEAPAEASPGDGDDANVSRPGLVENSYDEDPECSTPGDSGEEDVDTTLDEDSDR